MAENKRIKITLECKECHSRNYVVSKNKANNPERLEIMKHCPRCGKHTLHSETK